MMKKPTLFVARAERSGALLSVALLIACSSETSVESAEPLPNGAQSSGVDAVSEQGAASSMESDSAGDSAQPAAESSGDLAAQAEAVNALQRADAGTSGDEAGLCSLVPADDACGACLCQECGEALLECFDTPGCPEILACAEETGCQGAECYCGEASLSDCLGGTSNGPCKEVFLAAPGAREPSSQNFSAGPAAEAAGEVADCAEDDSACEDSCELD